jgi:hypothetical protein
MVSEALGGRPVGLIRSSWSGTNIEIWTPPEVLRDCGVTRSEISAAPNSTALYNTMIHPFTRMVIKGVIWYQGENNIYYNLNKYNCTFPKLIESWRNIWYTRTQGITDPTFPFGFVHVRVFSYESGSHPCFSLIACNKRTNRYESRWLSIASLASNI